MAKKIDPTIVHPEYPNLERRYDICEDAFLGEVCEYVPKLVNQSDKEYQIYISRAAYFNMVEKTVTAVCGALTRKPYVLSGYETFPGTEDGNGTTFIQESYRDLLLGARVAMLVDVNSTGQSYIINYDADDIINWFGNGTQPGDYVVIKECALVQDSENPFEQVEVESWRELHIDENGNYGVRIWTQTNSAEYVSETLPPFLVNGQPIKYIPLWVATPFDNSWDVYSPPLHSQASLNLQHFRQATDLAHYAHFMALPTFTIIGDLAVYTDSLGNQTTSPIKMGSTQEALHLMPGSMAQYTEVSGASFAMLQTEMAATEERMYIAGSRLLSSKNGVESATALQLRSGSETASLDTMCHSLQSALNAAIALCGEIDHVPNAGIQLNKDFTAAVTDPASIKALLDLYIAQTITLDQLLAELYLGEVVKPVVNIAETVPNNDIAPSQ